MPSDSEVGVATGIPGLDVLLGGGFGKGDVVALMGVQGSGKTTMALQFLHSGIKQHRENALYVTFDEQRTKLFGRMAKLGMQLEQMEESGALSVIEYLPQEADRFFAERQSVEELVKEKKVSRVVVDSVTTLMLSQEEGRGRMVAIFELLSSLRKLGCTSVLTAQASAPGSAGIGGMWGAEYLADCVISVGVSRERQERQFILEIVKAKGKEHDMKQHHLKLTHKGATVLP